MIKVVFTEEQIKKLHYLRFNWLKQTETKHKKALDSLLRLKFQTFAETKVITL